MLIAAAAADWVRRAQARVTWTVGLALNPCERVLAQSDDGAKRPPELKWYISEYMSDDAVLKHVSIIVGTFVVTLSDDFNDWFYQLKLMAGCYWMVGYILLELEKLASEVPELRYIVEKVLGQGTVPGSNWSAALRVGPPHVGHGLRGPRRLPHGGAAAQLARARWLVRATRGRGTG